MSLWAQVFLDLLQEMYVIQLLNFSLCLTAIPLISQNRDTDWKPLYKLLLLHNSVYNAAIEVYSVLIHKFKSLFFTFSFGKFAVLCLT